MNWNIGLNFLVNHGVLLRSFKRLFNNRVRYERVIKHILNNAFNIR